MTASTNVAALQGIASPFNFNKLLGNVKTVPYVFSYGASASRRPSTGGVPGRFTHLHEEVGIQVADAAAVKKQLAALVHSIAGIQVCRLASQTCSLSLQATFSGLMSAGFRHTAAT